MYCKSCGAQLKPGASFCVSCGTTLAAPEPTAPVAVKSSRTPLFVGLAIGLVVVLGTSAYAAVHFGLLEGLIASRTVTVSSDEEAPSADDISADKSSSGTAKATSASDAAEPAQLSSSETYDLLLEHYATLWRLHEDIGLQDKGAYTGTGFVFEPGGFNASIGHSDKNVRSELVDLCEEHVTSVTDARTALSSASTAKSYDSQKSALLALYDALYERTQAMYEAAVVAVDKPARDDGWGDKLQPRSQNGRETFESGYPSAEPTQL